MLTGQRSNNRRAIVEGRRIVEQPKFVEGALVASAKIKDLTILLCVGMVYTNITIDTGNKLVRRLGHCIFRFPELFA